MSWVALQQYVEPEPGWTGPRPPARERPVLVNLDAVAYIEPRGGGKHVFYMRLIDGDFSEHGGFQAPVVLTIKIDPSALFELLGL